jgi:hypothetical protein
MLRSPVPDLDGVAPVSSAICRSDLIDLNQARQGCHAALRGAVANTTGGHRGGSLLWNQSLTGAGDFIPLMQIKAAEWSATNIRE